MAPQEWLTASTQRFPYTAVPAMSESCLEQLAHDLSLALDTRYALLGELTDQRTVLVRALAGYPAARAPVSFSLLGSPAEQLGQSALMHCPRAARQLFPDDAL